MDNTEQESQMPKVDDTELPQVMEGIMTRLDERNVTFGYNLFAPFLDPTGQREAYIFPTPIPYRADQPESYLIVTRNGFRLIQIDPTPEGEQLKKHIKMRIRTHIDKEKTYQKEKIKDPTHAYHFGLSFWYSAAIEGRGGKYETLKIEGKDQNIEIHNEIAAASTDEIRNKKPLVSGYSVGARLLSTEDSKLILETIAVNENRAATEYYDENVSLARDEESKKTWEEQKKMTEEDRKAREIQREKEADLPQLKVAQTVTSLLK